MRRPLAWALAALAACGSKDERRGGDRTSEPPPSGPSTGAPAPSSPWPTLSPLPPLVEVVGRKPGAEGLVTAVRLLTPHAVVGDGFAVVLAWEGADEKPIGPDHALAKRAPDVAATVRSLTVHVRGPTGAPRALVVEPKPGPPTDGGWRMSGFRGVGVTIDDDGVRVARGKGTTWPFTAPAAIFGAPGKYVVRLAGKLTLTDGEPIPFETAEVAVEVAAAGPERLKLAEIEERASKAVAAQFGLRDAPPPAKPTTEDAQGNRVVRFGIHDDKAEYGAFHVELVYSPAGALLGGASVKVFTCVAEGTPVETPAGPRPVEALAPGDLVWGVDVERGRRVATEVRAATRSWAAETVEVEGLRATRHHPIFVDGLGFVEAGALRAGARAIGPALLPVALSRAPTPAGPAWVVELSVGWPHTYLAGGVLVHNKATQPHAARLVWLSDWEGIAARPRQP